MTFVTCIKGTQHYKPLYESGGDYRSQTLRDAEKRSVCQQVTLLTFLMWIRQQSHWLRCHIGGIFKEQVWQPPYVKLGILGSVLIDGWTDLNSMWKFVLKKLYGEYIILFCFILYRIFMEWLVLKPLQCDHQSKNVRALKIPNRIERHNIMPLWASSCKVQVFLLTNCNNWNRHLSTNLWRASCSLYSSILLKVFWQSDLGHVYVLFVPLYLTLSLSAKHSISGLARSLLGIKKKHSRPFKQMISKRCTLSSGNPNQIMGTLKGMTLTSQRNSTTNVHIKKRAQSGPNGVWCYKEGDSHHNCK